MAQNANIRIEMPVSAKQIKLPKGVNDRLQKLLDRQDRGEKLTSEEKRETEGLIELAEMLSLMRLRSEDSARIGSRSVMSEKKKKAWDNFIGSSANLAGSGKGHERTRFGTIVASKLKKQGLKLDYDTNR